MSWFTPASSRQHSSSHHNPHHSSSSSYYRRRPRDGYLNRVVHQLRRFFRDLIRYAQRHPVKVFMLVVLPLLTGGALHRVLRQFGIRLPSSLSGGGGKSFGGSSSRSSSTRRSEYEDYGGRGAIQGLMKVVQAFV